MTHIRLNPPLTENGDPYPGEANRIIIEPADGRSAAYVALLCDLLDAGGRGWYGWYAYLTREQTEALISELQKTLR